PTHIMCNLPLSRLSQAVPRSGSLRRELRQASREPWLTQWTEEPAEFEHFFTHMHVPFVTRRFGPDASYYGLHRLRRVFRFGGLVQLLDKGRSRAGLLCRRAGHTFESLVFGETNESSSILHAGGTSLLNEAFVRRAEALGCSEASFGLAPAQLQNGLFRYKKNWGVRITYSPYRRADYFMRWDSLNEPVFQFLAKTGFIFTLAGRLSALSVTDTRIPTEKARAVRGLLLPGLERLFLVHRETAQHDARTDHKRVITIPFGALRGQDSKTLKQVLNAYLSHSAEG
ncbi:MAG: hypothetical protein JSU96_19835, partial [Acidobacteriota bacterium]